MKLSKALRLSKTSQVAFVGAGGKTSALSNLAQELPKPLVVSTTTHMGTWQTGFADQHIIIQADTDWGTIETKLSHGITLLTQNSVGDRFKGLNNDQINKVHEICKFQQCPLLIECDGSRQLPLKAPGRNEPQIPKFVDTVVIVAGLTGLGNIVDEEMVYNSDQFSRLADLPLGEFISNDALETFLIHKGGGIKNIPLHAKRILILNQADSPNLKIQATKIAKKIQKNFNSIIVAELNRNTIHSVFEPSAAIILAAGSSSRYGQTKQLLDFHGKPFVTAVTHSAINAGLYPIVVVTGAEKGAINKAISDLSTEITIIHNPNWQSGQSTSIRAGINALDNHYKNRSSSMDLENMPGYPGSAIFLLVDQPQVTPAILLRLIEEHSHTLSPVIAPLVDGQRSNPVLFDRATFTDLMNLEGDIGGRGIFSKYSPTYVEWNDISLLLDVDDPSDYERLLLD